MLRNERGVTVIEMLMVIAFFITTATLLTAVFNNLMGQDGESGFVDRVIIGKAQDTRSTEIEVFECVNHESCELE